MRRGCLVDSGGRHLGRRECVSEGTEQRQPALWGDAGSSVEMEDKGKARQKCDFDQ